MRADQCTEEEHCLAHDNSENMVSERQSEQTRLAASKGSADSSTDEQLYKPESYIEMTEKSKLLNENEEEHPEKKGLSVCAATFFVFGDVVGAGIVALPHAMKLANWYGIPMFFVASLVMCYSGFLLAKSCNKIMVSEENRDELRAPYPNLAEHAYGKIARHIVTLALSMNLALTCIVFLLLVGEIFSKLAPLGLDITYRNELRIWFVICGLTVFPFTLLGTPKDFWGIGLLAMLTSAVAVCLLTVNLALLSNAGIKRPTPPPSNFEGLLSSFGSILFGFGGVAIFPTIQNDLKEPGDFYKSVTLGYSLVTLVYVSVPLACYVILGNLIKSDILTTMAELSLYNESWLFKCFVIICQGLICGHLLCAFILNVNPVHQQMEGFIKIPTTFCWQRCVTRFLTMVVMMLTAILVPNFGPLLSFVGGSFSGLLGIIFPVLFYAKLHENSCAKEILFGILILVALFGSVGNAYVEIRNIINVILDKYDS